jgi:hypothetical protein
MQAVANQARSRLELDFAISGCGSGTYVLAGSAERVLWFWTARETAWPSPEAGNEGQGVSRLDPESLIKGTDG